MTDQPTVDLCDCGWVRDTFACRVRHINVNVENLKRERD